MSVNERSVSRGRQLQAFSTGRGGVGNMRQPSVSTDARPQSGPDDFSVTRGREPIGPNQTEIFSTGRGGAGNMRSPSRDSRKPSMKEEGVIEDYKKSHKDAPVSTGRGGLGNIHRSRTPSSRDPATIPIVHSAGKKSGDGSVVERNLKGDIKGGEYHSTDSANTHTQHDNQSTAPDGAGKTVKETT